MQTLTEIRQLLEEAGLAPQKRFGQNFLIDKNLLAKLLELAAVDAQQTVLEVGPGTGTLTEELLDRCGRVVAVEIDRGLHSLLQRRLGDRANVVLLHQDVLADKRHLSPTVTAALGPEASLVSNLPYNIATPLVAQCLTDTWKVAAGKADASALCRFQSLTFTVQREVADRFAAGASSELYGQVSIVVALLGRVTKGPLAPPGAFWPRPNVDSRMMRIDFDDAKAGRLRDVETLLAVLNLAFAQRRKQIKSVLKRCDGVFDADRLAEALRQAGIDGTLRPEDIPGDQYLALANALAV